MVSFSAFLGRVMSSQVRLLSVCDVDAPCLDGWTFRQYFCTI